MNKDSPTSRYFPTIGQSNYPSKDKVNPADAQIVTDFEELSNLYLNLNNYLEDKKENGFLTFMRNFIMSSVSEDQIPASMSSPISSSTDDIIYSPSKSIEFRSPANIDNDQLFLTHYYENIPNASECQLHYFKDQVTRYMEKQNEALSHLQGFSFSNINDHFFPIALTERPSKGPLQSLFNNDQGQISKVKFSPEVKFSMIIQIVQGIAFIHKNNFIHSNLNPTTVYLNKKDEPIICDYVFIPQFQTTQVDEEKYQYSIDSETASQIYKSDKYVAPEILRGGTFDHQADIYSLGVIMLFILSEKEPTKNGDTFEFPENFPEKWKDVIEKCTRMEPSERMKLEEILDVLLDEEKAFQMIKSIYPKDETIKISEKTNLSLASIKRTISTGFGDVDFKIFRLMIPNLNDIDEDTKSVITAAENGHIQSIERIANYFITGEHNFYADEVWAFQCYEFAASKGSLFSLLKIAEFYEKGIGTNINLDLSYKNYQKAFNLMKEEDPKRSEIERKMNEVNDKMRLLKLKNVSLNRSEETIRSQFKNIETIDFQKGETSQNILIKFNTLRDLKLAIRQNKGMKKDKYSIEFYCNQKVKTHRFDSLVKKLPRLELSDFKLSEDKVGEGVSADAFIVYKNGEKEPYVAKVFSEVLADNLVNSFKREVIMSSAFKDYPAVVQYVGFNEYSLGEYFDNNGKTTEIRPTLFMKFVPGGNIEDAISKKPLEWWDYTKKLKMIIGIAAGLAKMHNNHIIHRDIKALNILLNNNSEPVICDLGCARQFTEEAHVAFTKNVGTAIYMAPEMYKDKFSPAYKCEVDSYSFGIVIYQILTLTPWNKLYPVTKPVQVMQKKMLNYLPSLDDIKSDLFKNIIRANWNTAVDDRLSPQSIFQILVDNIYNGNANLIQDANVDELKKYIETLVPF